MKILLVSHRFPWPLSHGTYLRVHALAKRFVQSAEVSLFSFGANDELVQRYTDMGVRFCGMHDPPVDGRPRFVLSPFHHDEQFQNLLSEELERGDYDAAILFGAKMLQYAELFKGMKVVADVVDDPVLEWRRLLKVNWYRSEGLRLGRYLLGWFLYERRYAQHLDHVVFVSETDSKSFALRNRKVSAQTIVNGVDLDFFRPMTNLSSEKSVVFTGNMAHQPNLDAALYLLKEIAPRVWENDPDIRFVVCGANTPTKLTELATERVQVLGWVDDIREPIARAGVVILPMISGTGIKNKLLEAWAMEKPVVMTTLSCQGVNALAGENCEIADTAETLARVVLSLFESSSQAEKIAVAGRQCVETFHNWDRLAADYTDLLVEKD
ncbi:glycosyltransferase [Geoalkalibacter subterraneus]|nr:glycosyltransferase [Geoalkalibacter subterraneus]